MLEINSKINSHLMTESKLCYKVQGVQSILTDEDYFHKAFLKPIEIALKNGQGSLPIGLQLALKDDISDNKYKLTDFDSPNLQQWKTYSYEKIIEKNLDNLLSLLKCQEGIQIAICVCMYTQDKKMLKSTLSGVSKNIEHFVKSGVSRDKIVVIVIMDGIQKVDDSVVQYFNELERQSNIMLDNQTQPIGLHDFLYNNSSKLFIDKDQEQTNINNLLFTQAELFDRQQRRFSSRVAEFKQIKNLSETIQKLKNVKGLSYEILDSRIQKFFIQVAKQRRKHEYGQDDEQLKSKDNDFFIQNYANDLTKSRPIIMQAMIRAKKFCDDYISTRSNLALLNYFRTGVFSSRQENKDLPEIQLNQTVIHSKMIRQSYDATQSAIHETTMNLLLCTKYKNLGKLSSHNWFFNGFCNQLQPKYSFLLDVGLTPQDNALYKMYRHLVTKQQVGGACGYMGLRIERNKDQLGYSDQLDQDEQTDFITRIFLRLADIQRAQQVEYHFAHLLDKPFEAQFKFIHVLPGAFSCYKMQALRMNNLLEQYFKSISKKQQQIEPSSFSPFQIIMKIFLPQFIFYKLWPLNEKSEEQMLYNQNIYLAEDRILCMGIHKNGKDISFIPDAYAWVDPIKNVHTLLGQRKRWINGTFFAFDKVKKQLQKSDKMQIGLKFQIYYLSFMNMLAYIAPSLFLFTVSVAVQVFRGDVLMRYFSELMPTQLMQGIVFAVNFTYIAVTVSVIFLSMHLTNKHKKFIPFIYAASTMMGIFATIITLILVTDIFRGSDQFLTTNKQFVDSLPFDAALLDSIRWIIISILIMYALPVLIYSLLYRKVSFAFDTIFGAFSFLFFSPTYLSLLNIYALCRINDISWGTKGLDQNATTKNQNLAGTWKIIRLIHVSKYFFWNVVASMILLTLGSQYVTRFFVTFFIMLLLALTMIIKLVVGCYYLISFYLTLRTANPVVNQDQKVRQNRIDELYFMIKPQMQLNIRANIDRIARQMKQNRQTGKQQKSGIVWGGKSKIIMPKEKKTAMRQCFQQFRKLNASRVIKNQTENEIFKHIQKQRISKNKDIYKRQKPHFTTASAQQPVRKRKKKPANIKLKAMFNSTKEKQSVNKVRFKLERDVKQQPLYTDTISMTIKEGIDKQKFRRQNTLNQSSIASNNSKIQQNLVNQASIDSEEIKKNDLNPPNKLASLNSSFSNENSKKKEKYRKQRIF